MQEFSTVSASSYDPAALAAKLTEKSAEGWTVVSIVPTGGDVTAFLSRDGSGDTAAEHVADHSVAEEMISSEPEPELVAEEIAAEPELVAEPEPVAEEIAAEPEPVVEEIAAEYVPAAVTTSAMPVLPEAVRPDPAPVAEPAGWAVAPEPAPATPMAPIVEATPTYEPAVTYQPAPSYDPAPAYQPAPVQAAPAVPAGWYADPAGRFELRYWDGTAWTEHVSRAGQQFTDPPVA